MELKSLTIKGYRSVKSIHFQLARLNVFYGGNGAGKTNLYNCLKLVQAAATGQYAFLLAKEGGMQSVLTDGALRGSGASLLSLEVTLGDDSQEVAQFSYSIQSGLVAQKIQSGEKVVMGDGFEYEPEIKTESLDFFEGRRKWRLLERKGFYVNALDAAMQSHDIPSSIGLFGSTTALNLLNEPNLFPELLHIKRVLSSWRFYHGFRTDEDSSIRTPCLAVSCPTLSASGNNLAAVLATMKYVTQDLEDVEQAIAEALDGAVLEVPKPKRYASFGLRFKDQPQRIYDCSELSDGTLQYICLVVALKSQRPPFFLALNEPENSLHSDMLPHLARLIEQAALRSQVWVVTHSKVLTAALQSHSEISVKEVLKQGGQTIIKNLSLDGLIRDDRF